jgi:cytoskeleton protein RodZ
MDIETTMTSETKPYNATSRIIRQAGLGERLRAARESMRISEKDAAIRLHLNPRIISIMENEEFENGPPETFMRGYIRSYGRLLSIPDSEIYAALTQIEPPVPAVQPATSITITRSSPSHRYLRAMTYVVIAILAVLVSVWWTSHPKDSVLKEPVVAPVKPESIAKPTAPIKIEPVAPVATTPTAPIANSNAPAPTLMQPSVTPPTQNTNVAPSIPNTTTINPAAPAANLPPTPAKPASNNLDDMDMSLSDPSLNQSDDGVENNESDTKYNKTHE